MKAHKGGKAKTDKNTEIVADKFEYNKTTSILTANGNVLATDSLNKTSIKAEEIEYNNITSEIIATKNVELRDFGTWSVQTQKTKLSRNPKTGEKIETPEKRKIRFKMSKKLFKKINNNE